MVNGEWTRLISLMKNKDVGKPHYVKYTYITDVQYNPKGIYGGQV